MRTDPKLVQSVLSMLQQWGWEGGLEKLRSRIGVADEDERSEIQFFVGWMAGERGAHAEALEQLRAVERLPQLTSWALAGQAFVALRRSEPGQAHELLDRAEACPGCDDAVLRATIAHCRGALFYKQAQTGPALERLYEAVALFGKEHFGTGRVYDTLGMCYASKNNFHAAREFYQQALDLKQKFNDAAGLAVSHGQLGRLYLEWGQLARAEEHFTTDLELTRKIHDEWGEVQMYNALGQVALARREWDAAAAWNERGADKGEEMGWAVPEGYARKDLALAHVGQGRVAEAEAQARRARELFVGANFAEGLAHADRVEGIIRRAQTGYRDAEKSLRRALVWFDAHDEHAEAARTQLETARTLNAGGTPRTLVTKELINALDRAENCHRDTLVREIEEELKLVDEAAYCRRVYRRARGRDVQADTCTLVSGVRDDASVLFLDVQGSTEFARNQDPEIVMMTLNQMMAAFAAVLERYEATVTAYLGDGFMALLRGIDHPRRAVKAGVDLVAALEEFNCPRRVLGLKPLNVRIGISSGAVFIGNVGTYSKMDFTAIGTTANRAARLQSEGEPGHPCISRSTFEQVRDHFVFKSDTPRHANLKGLDVEEAWDVIGERPAAPHNT